MLEVGCPPAYCHDQDRPDFLRDHGGVAGADRMAPHGDAFPDGPLRLLRPELSELWPEQTAGHRLVSHWRGRDWLRVVLFLAAGLQDAAGDRGYHDSCGGEFRGAEGD